MVLSANIFKVSNTGLHVNGASTDTSDKRFKEHINEIDVKNAQIFHEIHTHKTHNVIGSGRQRVGCIADDFQTNSMAEEWNNIVYESEGSYLGMGCSKTDPIVWSSLQYTMKESEDFKEMIKDTKLL